MVQTENPFFSVVVPSYERPADLMICLESLSDQNQVGAPSYEIIVSDDSNSDSSRILIEKDFPHVHWGKGKKIGPAGNRNAGVDRARGEWIVFLDDDCIAQKGYLAAYASAIAENSDVLVFEGRIFADRPRKTWAEGCPENEHGGMLWTSNLCVNRNLYNEMGGLDERFKIAYEDVDFATRLRKQEIETKFVPNASVCHPWRTLKQEGNNWKRKGYQFQELLIFLEKHPDQFKYHNPKIFIKHAVRALLKEIPTGLIHFRGRGSIFKLFKTLHSLQAALLLINFKYFHKFSKK
jgi:GT2 family glycosyltransferase